MKQAIPIRIVSLWDMTIGDGYQKLFSSLKDLYAAGEAKTMTNMVIEKLTGYTPTQRIMYHREPLTSSQEKEWNKMYGALLQFVPVQQVLEEAWFYGESFYVNTSVLIPRPETEELVDHALEILRDKQDMKVLDIGTGSGCISVTLKKKIPELEVWALEKYQEAIQVARRNATRLGAYIHFLQSDIFDEAPIESWPEFDLLVSNPPYILQRERAGMDQHVIKYEPGHALFVPDNEALVFYKRISEVAERKLKVGGWMVVEINEAMGQEVKALLEEKMSQVTIEKDCYGKDRLLIAQKL